MVAPQSSSYRGFWDDRENSTLDVFFGTGGASDPVQLAAISLGSWSVSHANAGAVSIFDVANTSNDTGAGARIRVSVGGNSATLDAVFSALETGGHELLLGIDTSGSIGVLAMDAALGSSDGDVIRITDATPPVITYNATSPSGTFDYVCDNCGAHGGSKFECCGPVAWHDDVMALATILEAPTGLRLTGDEPGIQHLAKLGVMEITPSDFPGEEGRNWVGMNPVNAQWFTWSGMHQMYRHIEDLERRLEAAGV